MLLEILLSGLISGLSAGIVSFLIVKHVERSMIPAFFDELLDFLASQEGIQTVGGIGQLLGAGFMSTLKFSPQQKQFKIFGMNIPSQIVEALINRYLPKGLMESAEGTTS